MHDGNGWDGDMLVHHSRTDDAPFSFPLLDRDRLDSAKE